MRNKYLAKYFREVTVDDIELIKHYLALRETEDSSQNIMNIIEWIDLAPLYEMHNEDTMWIIGEYPDHYYLYLPFCSKDKLVKALKDIKALFLDANEDLYMVSVNQEYRDLIAEHFKDAVIKEDRDNSDYVYTLANMRTFSGKKLQKKRNHLNQFYVLYGEHAQFEMLNSNNMAELYDYVLNSEPEEEMLDFEKQGILRVLDNFERIGAKGGLMRIDGKIQGYIIASPLTSRTIQQNVEKANHEYRGLSQVLIKEFFSRNYLEYEFLNREEDMGLPNLRKSKLSYYPIYMIDKFSVIL